MKKTTFFFVLLATVLILPWRTSAQTNQYLHFDRVDDYVILQDAGQYVLNSSEITMTGWFYTDELAYGQGMMGLRDGASGFYMIILNNGMIECRFVGSDGLFEFVAPNFTIVPEVWQHFAFVYDGSAITLYVNGIPIGSNSASGVLTNATLPFAIGKSTLGAGYNFVYGGRIDEVALWNKALSASEIAEIVENEITDTPEGLIAYYKFNQGVPGGDNTSITHLISEIGPDRDAMLMNFALVGETSNFGGDLNQGFQAITFPRIANHLTIDDPFSIQAEASSGLEVSFTITEGPATIEGNVITLTGETGTVTVKASQEGNEIYDPAEDVLQSFEVLDPYTYAPVVDARNPLEGNVFMPELDYLHINAYVAIDNPELFEVSSVEFLIEGQTLYPLSWFNGHYMAFWMPPAYGNYTLQVVAKNNYGATETQSIPITITDDVEDIELLAVDDVYLNNSVNTETVEAELPSFTGAFDQIMATLEVNCPPGGCGEWDRVGSVEAQAPNGEWIEIIRYVTPYGVACSHAIDLTDYSYLLEGKTKFRLNCTTFDNGYLYDLSLYYHAGTADYPHSFVSNVWHAIYPFGDYANLQPVETAHIAFPEETESATLKVVSTGHGWGDLNTSNAAEFFEATHHLWVNGEQTFEQHNWQVCNPNPDGCSPQSGTWFYNRAGWCPGSIAPWFDFNMNSFLGNGEVELDYVFDESYVDLCHPHHPDCVTGVTCDDCNDGYNPELHVACNIVLFSSEPLNYGTYTGNENHDYAHSTLTITPNPSRGEIRLHVTGAPYEPNSSILLYNNAGKQVFLSPWNGHSRHLNLTAFEPGIYFLKIINNKKAETFKILIQ
ncbi:MAG: peptide-N-glycosidase F-related protein [Bacteroidales bacterium]|nr:peptide-N-glycosidase F-related protein [Bacteroidales bacterium]